MLGSGTTVRELSGTGACRPSGATGAALGVGATKWGARGARCAGLALEPAGARVHFGCRASSPHREWRGMRRLLGQHSAPAEPARLRRCAKRLRHFPRDEDHGLARARRRTPGPPGRRRCRCCALPGGALPRLAKDEVVAVGEDRNAVAADVTDEAFLAPQQCPVGRHHILGRLARDDLHGGGGVRDQLEPEMATKKEAPLSKPLTMW